MCADTNIISTDRVGSRQDGVEHDHGDRPDDRHLRAVNLCHEAEVRSCHESTEESHLDT